MVAHKEILFAAKLLIVIKGKNELTPKEIFKVLKCAGSIHPITDIHTEMVKCCINSSEFHRTSNEYFERIQRGKYKLIQ